MATNNPRGFVPVNSLDGRTDFSHRRYAVSANNPTAIFIGDPVELNDGNVRVIDTSGASAGERGILGIVRAVYDSNEKPLTHSLPTNGQFIDGSTAGFVDVVDDPEVLFLVNSDATASQSMIGQFVRATAGTPSSAAGRSGFSLRLADTTNTSVGHRFKIVSVGPNELISGRAGQFANNQDIVVQISDHHHRRKVNLTGTVSASPV